jgi:hypothetical protein
MSNKSLETDSLFVRAWDWCFVPLYIYPMVICRIVFGSVVFCHSLTLIPFFESYFASGGLAEFLQPSWKPLAPYAAIILGVNVCSSLTFTVGHYTSISGCCLIATHYLLSHSVGAYSYGWYSKLLPMLIFVLLSRPGSCYSIDSLRGKVKRRRFVSALPIRFLQIEVVMIYVGGAWYRLVNESWLDGEVVYAALTNSTWSRLPHVDWYIFKPLLVVGNYASLFLEVVAPIALWIPTIGPITALGLIILHAALEISTTVGWWQIVMMSAVTVFLPATWTHRTLEGFMRPLRMIAKKFSRIRIASVAIKELP